MLLGTYKRAVKVFGMFSHSCLTKVKTASNKFNNRNDN